MVLKGNGDDEGADRRARAKRTLEDCAAHAVDCVDNASAVLHDGTELAARLLDGGTPPERSIADFTALSIDALSMFCRCFHHHDGEVPGTLNRLVPEPQEAIELVFDIRSESAGPLELNTASPLTWVDTTDLVGAGGRILSQRVLVRTLGASIMISLCDLRNVKAGSYEGTVIFTDAGGNPTSLKLRAECRNELWWADALM
jgi:hypothetical protein